MTMLPNPMNTGRSPPARNAARVGCGWNVDDTSDSGRNSPTTSTWAGQSLQRGTKAGLHMCEMGTLLSRSSLSPRSPGRIGSRCSTVVRNLFIIPPSPSHMNSSMSAYE